MSKSTMLALLTLALAGSLSTEPALAADFEITVPVEITMMPETTLAYVACEVSQGSYTQSNYRVMGSGLASVPEARGALDEDHPAVDYSGSVLVKVDVDNGEIAALVDGYACELHLGWSSREDFSSDPVLSFEDCIKDAGIRDPSTEPLLCGGRGKKVVGAVEGTF